MELFKVGGEYESRDDSSQENEKVENFHNGL